MSLVGTMVGRIRVLDTLGKGGMGEVYAGWDETLERRVALKAIRREQQLDAEAKARFLREARILSQLDHPGICRIYELIEEEECDILVLELIEGQSLRRALDRKGPRSPDGSGTPGSSSEEPPPLEYSHKLFIAERVATALMAAHAKGVAHRDLKPENVMLTDSGDVKVLDFGLAHTVGNPLGTESAGGLADPELTGPSDTESGTDEASTAETVVAWERAGEGENPSTADTVVAARAREGEPPLAKDLGHTVTQVDPLARHSAAPDQVTPDTPAEGMANVTLPTVIRPPMGRGQAPGDGASGPPAKPTDAPRAEEVFQTRAGVVMGTLAYMSPEQARGERSTAAGDMYALGLMLQEMFTGESAYDLKQKPLRLLMQASTGETRPVVGLDPDLAKLIESLKALAPEARPTAMATADRLWWIAGKRRRLYQRIGVAVVILLLFFGLIKYTLDLRREQIRALETQREAERVSEFLLNVFAVADPQTTRGAQITARELLDSGAQRIGELREQPRTRARLMLTMGRAYRQLGLYDRAFPLLDQALEIQRSLDTGSRATSLETANYLDQLASVHHERGQPREALPLFRQALEARRSALGEDHPNVAASLANLAFAHQALGELDEVEPLLLEALSVQESTLAPGHPHIAASLANLGELYRTRGETARAEPYLRRAAELQERQAGGESLDLATSLNNLGLVQQQLGEVVRAEAYLRRSLTIAEQILGPEHPHVSSLASNLGRLFGSIGRFGEAESLYTRALAIQERSLGERHPRVISLLVALADLLTSQGRYAEAEALYLRALSIHGRPEPAQEAENATGSETEAGAPRAIVGDTDSSLEHSVVLNHLGDLFALRGDGAAAEVAFRQALRVQERLVASSDSDSPQTGPSPQALALAWTRFDLGERLRRSGRPEAATELVALASSSMQSFFDQRPEDREIRLSLARMLIGEGDLHESRGEHEDANAAWERALELLAGVDDSPREFVDQQETRALALLHLDRAEEARPLIESLLARGWTHPKLLSFAADRGLELEPTAP